MDDSTRTFREKQRLKLELFESNEYSLIKAGGFIADVIIEKYKDAFGQDITDYLLTMTKLENTETAYANFNTNMKYMSEAKRYYTYDDNPFLVTSNKLNDAFKELYYLKNAELLVKRDYRIDFRMEDFIDEITVDIDLEISEILLRFSPLEKEIFYMKMGLDDGKNKDVREISERLDVPEEFAGILSNNINEIISNSLSISDIEYLVKIIDEIKTNKKNEEKGGC